MNPPIQWTPLFNNQFGDRTIYRLFVLGDKIFAVGFEFVATINDLSGKGISISSVNPAFHYPASGVWGIIFDEIDPVSLSFKGFQHIAHAGLGSGRVLPNVASTILEHYTACGAGAYVFSAAVDSAHLRRSDLVMLYDRMLGLNGNKKGKLFREHFVGWKACSDTSTGGRGYVITTASYS